MIFSFRTSECATRAMASNGRTTAFKHVHLPPKVAAVHGPSAIQNTDCASRAGQGVPALQRLQQALGHGLDQRRCAKAACNAMDTGCLMSNAW